MSDFYETCRSAVTYLLKVQRNDGFFGPKEMDVFAHVYAMALALTEFLGLMCGARPREPL